ncbi:hypothetical protein [Pontibacter populi]|uniref:DUF4837 family protein n=1 Tax=Pontibacter populi TaxID=890055 RepID=A0ABV1RQ84_9BACT
MKINFTLIVFVLFQLVSTNIEAQRLSGSINDLEEFKKRPLVIVLNETAGKQFKKYYNVEQDTAFNRVNRFMVKSISDYWKDEAEIIFIKPEEISKYTTNKKTPEKYAILQLRELFNYNEDHPTVTIYPTNYFILSLSEQPDKKIYLYKLHDIVVTPAEVAKSLMHIQHFLNKSVEEGKKFEYKDGLNSTELKELTLLIDEKKVYRKLTRDEIEKNYGLRYEITSKERIDEVILNKTPGYAFIIIQGTSSNNDRANQYVMRAETGDIIASSISSYVSRTMNANFFIEKYNLKEYVKSIATIKK